MKDFLLNRDFSMLQIPSDNLIPQTTGVFMSRTIKMTFNVHQRTFELGDMLEFLPKSNKIQEIESSDRTGVIGFVEQVAGLIEIIYYDRYIN